MAKIRNVSDFPEVTRRIWGIVEEECGGNVNRFTSELGMSNGSKVQRLFVRDKRNGDYPTPSTDIVTSIHRRYPTYSVSYILLGERDAEKGTVNNINVTKTNGNSNIVGDNNSTELNERMMAMLEQQQNQINALFKVLAEKL